MKQNELALWLQTRQPNIEKVIQEAAQAFIAKHQQQPNFGHDLNESQKEAYGLMNSKDLCYDRYTTPLAYSLWYQGRRINVFASHFLDKIVEACTSYQPVDIFDVGAGTGCVQFCFGLAAVAFYSTTGTMPLLRIINVDVSPFMLDYLRSFLWPAAIKEFPELKKLPVEYHVYSWTNRSDFSITNPWVCASYLFDSSENESYLVSNFSELIQSFQPSKILLLTSAQHRKQQLMQSLADKMKRLSYQVISPSITSPIFKGNLATVTAVRQQLIRQYNLVASSRPVSWEDGSFTALGLEKQQSGFAFDMRQRPELFDLFNPPLRIRREVRLNEEQIKAAKYEDRPSVITGPAGCGKSIVVTEKIMNTLEKHGWAGPLSLLVTTFNKALLKQLRAWLTDLLAAKGKPAKQIHYKTVNGVGDGTGEIRTGEDYKINIRFVHFEMLPYYVGQIKNIPYDENNHRKALELFISETRKELEIPASKMNNILNPDFLLEEYHRVIYGLQCKLSFGEDFYQSIEREGRGTRVSLNAGIRRKAVWTALHKYGVWMHKDPNAGQSFLARRQLLYNKLADKTLQPPFDYVFVDEFQDCTPADYKIMSMLLKDVDKLVLAGDLAQAVHIGQSGTIPRDEAMAKRIYHRLKGSYRLPFRICEAIYPLSLYISKNSINKDVTAEITPYKGAPPGARPVVVYADNNQILAQKIEAIKKCYGLFELQRLTIMEKDDDLCKEIKKIGIPVETTTILRLKGLEKEFIVWSLQADIEYENEVMEFAYTIMTRTNCLLVIAITQNRKDYYRPVFPLLEQERLIFWDKQSVDFYGKIISERLPELEVAEI